jgi:hypothetical protein
MDYSGFLNGSSTPSGGPKFGFPFKWDDSLKCWYIEFKNLKLRRIKDLYLKRIKAPYTKGELYRYFNIFSYETVYNINLKNLISNITTIKAYGLKLNMHHHELYTTAGIILKHSFRCKKSIFNEIPTIWLFYNILTNSVSFAIHLMDKLNSCDLITFTDGCGFLHFTGGLSSKDKEPLRIIGKSVRMTDEVLRDPRSVLYLVYIYTGNLMKLQAFSRSEVKDVYTIIYTPLLFDMLKWNYSNYFVGENKLEFNDNGHQVLINFLVKLREVDKLEEFLEIYATEIQITKKG